MRFLQGYFRPIDFQKLVTESKQLLSKSSHKCVLCNNQLALHFIGKNIQVESCYSCQKVWFEREEIKKIQKYTLLRNEGKTIYLDNGTSDIPFTNFIFDETLNHSTFLTTPSAGTLVKIAQVELVTNYVGNKIADSKFFKKYPILTFCIVITVLVWYFK